MKKQKLLAAHGLILGALALYIIFLQVTKIYCPLRFITGLACPFCGISRAWLLALRGQWGAAFRYHPLFLPGPVLIFLAVHRSAAGFAWLRRRWATGLTFALAGAFVAVWLVRLTGGLIP